MSTRILSCSLVLAAAVLGGCSQFESVRDRFSPPAPQVRVIQGEPRQVYDAARQAMERTGYQFTGGGPAQGRLDGLSAISRGGSFGAAQQRSIEIQLAPAETGSVEVKVLIKETIEREGDRSSGTATEQALRDPAAYDSFFALLQQLLKGGAGN